LDPDSLLQFPIRSEIWISPRLSASSSMSQLDVGVDALTPCGWRGGCRSHLNHWQCKTRVSKTKAAPSSSATLRLKQCHRARQGIFDEHPYLVCQLSMFYHQAHRGIPPEVVDCRWGMAEIWNTKVQGTRNFRQVRAIECVIPYILCGGLYCLR
jgi:hypothetical protein